MEEFYIKFENTGIWINNKNQQEYLVLTTEALDVTNHKEKDNILRTIYCIIIDGKPDGTFLYVRDTKEFELKFTKKIEKS